MEFKKVIYDTSNRVATILLNRPKAMNAFETQLRLDLMAAISQAEGDDDVRVIIISGVGRGFSAGADLQHGIEPYDTIEDQILAEYKPFLMAIHNSPKLFISAVNGPCAGIATALTMVCDLTVMAEDAYLYQAFAAIGLVKAGSWNRPHSSHINTDRGTNDHFFQVEINGLLQNVFDHPRDVIRFAHQSPCVWALKIIAFFLHHPGRKLQCRCGKAAGQIGGKTAGDYSAYPDIICFQFTPQGPAQVIYCEFCYPVGTVKIRSARKGTDIDDMTRPPVLSHLPNSGLAGFNHAEQIDGE